MNFTIDMLKNPIIIRNSKIPKLLSWVIDIHAITLFPFVFIRDEGNEATVRHETIHFRQYIELAVLGFFIVYLWDYVVGLIKYRDGKKAYSQIRLEQEAYMHHRKKNYLENRKHYAWLKYKATKNTAGF